jgi:hypothetical protein
MQAQEASASVAQEASAKKPYRTLMPDIFNKLYADCVKKSFETLAPAIKTEFEKFTENVIQEEYISRHCFLNALDDFYKINFRLCDSDYKWTRVYDIAWNCRPYQS